MYANAQRVKSLARNRISTLSDDELAAAAEMADAEIDMRLGVIFYWPISSSGVDQRVPAPPAQITIIANYLTAAMLESQIYAQNEAGGLVANPYGRMLMTRGTAMLDRLEAGDMVIPSIQRGGELSGVHARAGYRPVYGLFRDQGIRR